MSLYREINIKLQIIITMVLMAFLLFFCSAYAAVDTSFDCGQAPSLIKSLTNGTFSTRFTEAFGDAYPVENARVAATHLLAYCCEKKWTNAEDCAGAGLATVLPGSLLYAESPYLYDHLIDVGFRRLDGDEATQYPDAKLDDAGKTRRKNIRDYATATNGVIPRIILEQYGMAWEVEKSIPYSSETNPDFKTISKNRSTYGLKNKYFTTCYLAQYINNGFISAHDVRESTTVGNTDLYNSCIRLANTVIEKEFNYVKFVMIQQGANLIANNIHTYVNGYFVQGKLQDMLTNFNKMQSDFATIVQKVNEGTKDCSGG